MKIGYIFLAIFVFCHFNCQSQSLTKRQIYNEWVKSYAELNKDSFLLRVTQYDSLYQTDFINTMKRLKKNHIDTFGFIKITSIGQTKKAIGRGSRIYLFWQAEDKYYLKLFCDSMLKEVSIEDSKFITFFKEHYDEIEKDYLLPPIYTIMKDRNKVEYSEGVKFHEKRYTLFCQLGEKNRSYEFGESYINDDRSLFYVDNISTSLFHWFVIANAEIKKSESFDK